MTAHARQASSTIALLTLLCAASLWSYGVMASSHKAAQQAATDTELCQRLADRIGHLQRRPSLAGSQELAMAELARRIEQAASAAQIEPSSLVSILPEAARRLGDHSVYKEKPTQLLLRGVTLRQIIAFLHGLTSRDGGGLIARQIRISVPPEQETADQDRWVLETTLSYLIYAPPSAMPAGMSDHTVARGDAH